MSDSRREPDFLAPPPAASTHPRGFWWFASGCAVVMSVLILMGLCVAAVLALATGSVAGAIIPPLAGWVLLQIATYGARWIRRGSESSSATLQDGEAFADARVDRRRWSTGVLDRVFRRYKLSKRGVAATVVALLIITLVLLIIGLVVVIALNGGMGY